MSNTLHNTVLEVSWSKLLHNLNYFKNQLKPSTKVMLMVKADAYGYGANLLVQKLSETTLVNYLGVATIQEGIELRTLGINLPIMVQNPSPNTWDLLVQYNLEPILHNEAIWNSFNHFLAQHLTSSKQPYPAHLKLNTGMNRFGFNQSELSLLVKLLKETKHFQIHSVLSHLSSSGNYDEQDFTLQQIKTFKELVENLRPYLPSSFIAHLLNTDGINSYLDAQLDMIRIGIGLYGGSENSVLRQHLQPVATFWTKVVEVREVQQGETVSYNRSGKVDTKSRVAVLAFGYADGFPRKLGNGNWHIEINNRLYPTLGNICMDACMVNLGNDEVNVDDKAIIFGGINTIFDYAQALDTISYEAVTMIGKRVKRIINEAK